MPDYGPVKIIYRPEAGDISDWLHQAIRLALEPAGYRLHTTRRRSLPTDAASIVIELEFRYAGGFTRAAPPDAPKPAEFPPGGLPYDKPWMVPKGPVRVSHHTVRPDAPYRFDEVEGETKIDNPPDDDAKLAAFAYAAEAAGEGHPTVRTDTHLGLVRRERRNRSIIALCTARHDCTPETLLHNGADGLLRRTVEDTDQLLAVLDVCNRFSPGKPGPLPDHDPASTIAIAMADRMTPRPPGQGDET